MHARVYALKKLSMLKKRKEKYTAGQYEFAALVAMPYA